MPGIPLTVEQRVFIVKTYFETKKLSEVGRLFIARYPDRPPLSKNSIWYNVQKYLRHGTSQNRQEKHSGRRKTGRSQENIDAVQAVLENNPSGLSCRVNTLGLPSATFNRIVRIDLRWHPYKMQVRHQLKPGDFARRTAFCEWFLEKNRNPRFLHNFVIGDEAGFAMNGQVNTQNVRKYAPRKNQPEFTYDVNESREKVTAWAGLVGNGTLIGPFFFEQNVNRGSYLELLNESVLPELLREFNGQFADGRFQRLWWAQDGAPPHRSAEITDWLAEFFGDHVIALQHDPEWPPRSPDLTPCDYFLWGYVKSKVFVSPPDSIDDLKNRISQTFTDLKANHGLIRRAVRDMIKRVNICIERDGGHVEGKFG